ncbi:MAG: hypothetical protein IPK28_23080 [Devosia sp.]|nr:hypothetical protein [Devosia sp.]
MARSWEDCADITHELAGRAIDPGHLELIVPMFRVAHIALDTDGRQVGEANVFPRPLRLDTPTEWMACPFPGTRYMADRPMNTSALKAMRNHWQQMMAALKLIRARFLERFPAAADRWTLAHVERLAALVLAVPTYQLVRKGADAAPLHPALSSLFRVTDGLRMATHQMMFIPVGEPVLPPDSPITAEAIFDYAERNYSFHSRPVRARTEPHGARVPRCRAGRRGRSTSHSMRKWPRRSAISTPRSTTACTPCRLTPRCSVSGRSWPRL